MERVIKGSLSFGVWKLRPMFKISVWTAHKEKERRMPLLIFPFSMRTADPAFPFLIFVANSLFTHPDSTAVLTIAVCSRI
jgi:hypothetical protein